jgi:hypothetical protein
MIVMRRLRIRGCLGSAGRTAFIFLAIFSLTVSLATRYTGTNSDASNARAVNDHSPDAQRQHLLSDGLKWSAPPYSFTLFQQPRSFVFAVSADFPATNLCSETWLYNRPPPTP